jgi:hypothetical protein
MTCSFSTPDKLTLENSLTSPDPWYVPNQLKKTPIKRIKTREGMEAKAYSSHLLKRFAISKPNRKQFQL